MCVGGLFWEMTSGNRDGGLESEKLQQGHIVKLTIASGNLRTVLKGALIHWVTFPLVKGCLVG